MELREEGQCEHCAINPKNPMGIPAANTPQNNFESSSMAAKQRRSPNQTTAPQGFQMWYQCRAENQTPQAGREVLEQNVPICRSGIL